MALIDNIKEEFKKFSSAKKAKDNAWFFKTYEGGYGEGDKFLGLTVPVIRQIVKRYYKQASFSDVKELLNSKYHEHRLAGAIMLVEKFKREKDEKERKKIYDFYLNNRSQINNWDIVDSSAHKIIGEYLLDKDDRSVLYDLARSGKLWDQRIAVISTMTFIKNGDFKDNLKIAEILLDHEHDLIHKAVGWMLREIGKIDQEVEEKFLKKHYKDMPRTMLRYAIEKFDEKKRQSYLKGKV